MPDDPDTGGDAPEEREDHDEEATVDGFDMTADGDGERTLDEDAESETDPDAGADGADAEAEEDVEEDADVEAEDGNEDVDETEEASGDETGDGEPSEAAEDGGEGGDGDENGDGTADEDAAHEAEDEDAAPADAGEDGTPEPSGSESSTYGPEPPDEPFASPDPPEAGSLLDDDDLDLEADADGEADGEAESDDADAGTLATDGDGAVAGAGAGTGAGAGAGAAADASFIDDGVASGPESDVEMPLTEHIEEMIRRLAVVFAVGGLVTLLLYPGADLANALFDLELVSATDVINHLWNRHIPGTELFPDRRPRLYGPLELLLTQLKVAGLGGLVVALPVVVYESYLFMRPGLYPKERRYYLAAVPTSVVLGVVGVLFAHFAVLPAIFAYFTSYTQGTAVVAFGLRETFNLILILMGYMAIVFQIPLFIMLAIMMELVTPQWLRDRRLLFWGGFLGLSFIATPDPTGMAPIIVAATMIVLFETTLYGLRLSGR